MLKAKRRITLYRPENKHWLVRRRPINRRANVEAVVATTIALCSLAYIQHPNLLLVYLSPPILLLILELIYDTNYELCVCLCKQIGAILIWNQQHWLADVA